jgi:hypothetical protein
MAGLAVPAIYVLLPLPSPEAAESRVGKTWMPATIPGSSPGTGMTRQKSGTTACGMGMADWLAADQRNHAVNRAGENACREVARISQHLLLYDTVSEF